MRLSGKRLFEMHAILGDINTRKIAAYRQTDSWNVWWQQANDELTTTHNEFVKELVENYGITNEEAVSILSESSFLMLVLSRHEERWDSESRN
jgi:hypothetical protein